MRTLATIAAVVALAGCTTRPPVLVAENHPADATLPCDALIAEHTWTVHKYQRLGFLAKAPAWPGAGRTPAIEAESYRHRARSLALNYGARCGGLIPQPEPYVHLYPEDYSAANVEGNGAWRGGHNPEGNRGGVESLNRGPDGKPNGGTSGPEE